MEENSTSSQDCTATSPKEELKAVCVGNPEFFLIAIACSAALGAHIKWHGAVGFDVAVLLSVVGAVVGLVRWGKLTLHRKIMTILLVGLAAVAVIALASSIV